MKAKPCAHGTHLPRASGAKVPQQHSCGCLRKAPLRTHDERKEPDSWNCLCRIQTRKA